MKIGPSEKGFVLTSVLIALPIIFSVALGLAHLGSLIIKSDRHVLSCQKSSYQVSRLLVTELKVLLAMNKTAKILRLSRKSADALLAASIATGNPAAILKAQRLRTAVKRKQRAFKKLQSLTYKASKAALRVAVRNHKYGLQRVLKSIVRIQAAQLKLEPKPKGSDSPSLIPSKNFETESSLISSWVLEHKSTSAFTLTDKTYKRSCATGLIQTKEGAWKIKLVEGKS